MLIPCEVTDTPMIDHLREREGVVDRLAAAHPFRGMGEPEDIAKAALFLASEDASWITGGPLPVDGQAPPLSCSGMILTLHRGLHSQMNIQWALSCNLCRLRLHFADGTFSSPSQLLFSLQIKSWRYRSCIGSLKRPFMLSMSY